jgi:hypothetical protein
MFCKNPAILWITLLIPAPRLAASLENQGFTQNARENGKVITLRKSTSCDRYWICSNRYPRGHMMAHRSTSFVHK